MTKKQKIALDLLRSLDISTLKRTDRWNVETGMNTRTLQWLKDAGYISATAIYLRGIVTPDIRIITKIEKDDAGVTL